LSKRWRASESKELTQISKLSSLRVREKPRTTLFVIVSVIVGGSTRKTFSCRSQSSLRAIRIFPRSIDPLKHKPRWHRFNLLHLKAFASRPERADTVCYR